MQPVRVDWMLPVKNSILKMEGVQNGPISTHIRL